MFSHIDFMRDYIKTQKIKINHKKLNYMKKDLEKLDSKLNKKKFNHLKDFRILNKFIRKINDKMKCKG